VREGAQIAMVARNQERLSAAADQLRRSGANVLSISADITQESQVVALFEKAMQEFGRIDILVNNAGIYEESPIDQMSLEMWQRTIDADLTAPFLCTREAMKIMKRQGGGRIINIGSIAAQMPRPKAVSYNCAKIGLVALTRTTALEGREFHVVASCVHPGNVATDQVTDPKEPTMAIEDIAKAVVTIATLPLHVNMIETVVFPVAQPYLGRG
jgi:NAD(P)-dependent dehydrogenase (short-subunit alcohol dehydrogenase family)